MSHRLNVMIDEQIWESLQKLPKGERSRYINQAVKERLTKEMRKKAATEIDRLRESLPKIDDNLDVDAIIQKDRLRDN